MEETHTYKTVLVDCRLCGAKKSLVKDLSCPIPSLKIPEKTVRTGDEVKRAIGEAKQDMKKTQKDLKSRTSK
jgi:hypothetical protein